MATTISENPTTAPSPEGSNNKRKDSGSFLDGSTTPLGKRRSGGTRKKNDDDDDNDNNNSTLSPGTTGEKSTSVEGVNSSTGNQNNNNKLPSAIEFEPPLACVRRILKRSLPSSTNVGKDACAAFARACGIFIIYVTACANDFARENKRQTITANDVISACKELDFEDFTPDMEKFLESYRFAEKTKKNAKAAAAAAVVKKASEDGQDEDDDDDQEDEDDHVEEEEEDHEVEDDNDGDDNNQNGNNTTNDIVITKAASDNEVDNHDDDEEDEDS